MSTALRARTASQRVASTFELRASMCFLVRFMINILTPGPKNRLAAALGRFYAEFPLGGIIKKVGKRPGVNAASFRFDRLHILGDPVVCGRFTLDNEAVPIDDVHAVGMFAAKSVSTS